MRRHSLWIWTRITISLLVSTLTTLVQLSVSLGIVPSIAESSLYRQLFDHGKWLLMPEDCILEKYRESLDHVGAQSFPRRKGSPEFSVCLLIMTLIWISKLFNLRKRKHFFINLCLCKRWEMVCRSSAEISFQPMGLQHLLPITAFICIHSRHSPYSKAIFTLNSPFLMLGKNCQF